MAEMRKIHGFLAHVELWLIATPAIAALVLVAQQALARHLYPPLMYDWAEEVVIYLLMAAVFLSLGRISAEGSHIRAELVIDLLPPRWRRWIEIGVAALAVALWLWLAWWGWEVAAQAKFYDDRTSSSLRFPIWIYYAILPLGSMGLAIGFLFRALRLLSTRPEQETQT